MPVSSIKKRPWRAVELERRAAFVKCFAPIALYFQTDDQHHHKLHPHVFSYTKPQGWHKDERQKTEHKTQHDRADLQGLIYNELEEMDGRLRDGEKMLWGYSEHQLLDAPTLCTVAPKTWKAHTGGGEFFVAESDNYVL